MYIKYDRESAVEYARNWSLGRNPEYYDYEKIGGDCTNFVSQCVYAGCGVMNYNPENGWYYINANEKSPSWTGVNFFYNFMTNNAGAGPYGVDVPLSSTLPGDVIQLGNNLDVYYHSLLLTEIKRTPRGVRYMVSAHSMDVFQRNLRTYNFQKLRCIHILGARTE